MITDCDHLLFLGFDQLKNEVFRKMLGISTLLIPRCGVDRGIGELSAVLSNTNSQLEFKNHGIPNRDRLGFAGEDN